MPETSRERFAKVSAVKENPPLPKVPKMPLAIRNRFPDLQNAFDEYDALWEEFHRQKNTIDQA